MSIFTSVQFPTEWADEDRRDESIKEIVQHIFNGAQIILDDGPNCTVEYDIRNVNESLFDVDPHKMDAQIQLIALGGNDVSYLRQRANECAEKIADEVVDYLVDQRSNGFDVERNVLKTVSRRAA
jgi:hypothetical protein